MIRMPSRTATENGMRHAQFLVCEDRPRLHYTGLHRSVAIFIPDSAAAYSYTTPQQSRTQPVIAVRDGA